MKGVSRVLLGANVFLFIGVVISLFVDWVALLYDGVKYPASPWSDSAADIKYIIIFLVLIGIVTSVVALRLVGQERILNGILLVISIAVGLLGIFYYLQQQGDIDELRNNGFEVSLQTEIGFYLFITFFALLLLSHVIGIVLPNEEE